MWTLNVCGVCVLFACTRWPYFRVVDTYYPHRFIERIRSSLETRSSMLLVCSAFSLRPRRRQFFFPSNQLGGLVPDRRKCEFQGIVSCVNDRSLFIYTYIYTICLLIFSFDRVSTGRKHTSLMIESKWNIWYTARKDLFGSQSKVFYFKKLRL